MLKNMMLTVIIIFIAIELIDKHIIFPIGWSIFKGRKRSTYGVMSMMGKVVEIRRWNKTDGQVFINGELWKAVSEVHLLPGDRVVIQNVVG